TAPGGPAMLPVRPMRAITPRSTRTAPFSIAGLPSPEITRALSNSNVCAGAGPATNTAARTNRTSDPIALQDMGRSLPLRARPARLSAVCAPAPQGVKALLDLEIELADQALVLV